MGIDPYGPDKDIVGILFDKFIDGLTEAIQGLLVVLLDGVDDAVLDMVLQNHLADIILIEEVDKKATRSYHYDQGYNSEQKEIAQLPKIGLQHVTMTYSSEDAYPEIWIDNKKVSIHEVAKMMV